MHSNEKNLLRDKNNAVYCVFFSILYTDLHNRDDQKVDLCARAGPEHKDLKHFSSPALARTASLQTLRWRRLCCLPILKMERHGEEGKCNLSLFSGFRGC